MSFLAFLNHWWNYPYLFMLGLGFGVLLLQLLGFVGAGHEHDAGHDVGHDVAHDAHHEVSHDASAAGHGTADILAFFGVGHVPVMGILLTLFFFLGLSGLAINRAIFVARDGRFGAVLFTVAFVAALIAGLFAVRAFARLAGRLVDTAGKPATRKSELVGRAGVVASPHIDGEHGEVRVHDADGNEILLHGRLQDGDPTLAQGVAVVLVDYDPKTDLYWVAAAPDVDAP